jgi:hypothetical protein
MGMVTIIALKWGLQSIVNPIAIWFVPLEIDLSVDPGSPGVVPVIELVAFGKAVVLELIEHVDCPALAEVLLFGVGSQVRCQSESFWPTLFFLLPDRRASGLSLLVT